ncbi:MAG: hypothetical protein NHB15_16530 [Methanosarcina barkeri]|nr:hypothetical protein [Methanosarcina sp. ERenArc_MAG2]
MVEEDQTKGNVMGGPGITSGGDVTFGNSSGQVGIGQNIDQSLFQSINQTNLRELRESLLEFQKEIGRLGLDPNYQNIINGDISKAVIEAKKEQTEPSKIRQYFEAAIQTTKDAGRAISSISELYEPAKKIAKILGTAISFLL